MKKKNISITRKFLIDEYYPDEFFKLWDRLIFKWLIVKGTRAFNERFSLHANNQNH